LRDTKRTLGDILAYSNPRVVDRYSKDYNTSDEQAVRCFDALKQFMYVCAAVPGYKVTSEPIDGMWHTFLLFTKAYREFCDDYLGASSTMSRRIHRPAYFADSPRAAALCGSIDEGLWPGGKLDRTSGCQD
jgi:hypothetical protein